MDKFRASFSTLNLWSSGDYDNAIAGYFKTRQFISPQMAEGKRYHETWESEVTRTKCLPTIFGGSFLKEPKMELKIVKQLDNWLELVGVIDLYSDYTIYDYKTGKTSSQSMVNSMQLPVYKILIPEANKGVILHYDQYLKQTEVSYLYLTDKIYDKALEWVVTYSSEMFNYINDNQIDKQLGF
jgi:hypothetical protein